MADYPHDQATDIGSDDDDLRHYEGSGGEPNSATPGFLGRPLAISRDPAGPTYDENDEEAVGVIRSLLEPGCSTREIVEAAFAVGLSPDHVARAAGSRAGQNARNWAQGSKPNQESVARLDDLRALLGIVLTYRTLVQPLGTGRWLVAKRLVETDPDIRFTNAIEQIRAGRLEDAVRDAQSSLGSIEPQEGHARLRSTFP